MPVAAWVEWLPLVACGCLCSVVAYGCLYRYKYRYRYRCRCRYNYRYKYKYRYRQSRIKCRFLYRFLQRFIPRFPYRIKQTLLLGFFGGIIRF